MSVNTVGKEGAEFGVSSFEEKAEDRAGAVARAAAEDAGSVAGEASTVSGVAEVAVGIVEEPLETASNIGGTGGAVFGLRVSKHKHDHVIDEMLGIKIGHEVVEVLGGAGKG